MPSVTNSLVIRAAVPQDSSEIADVYLASRADSLPTVRVIWDEASTRAWIASWFHSEGTIFVAELDGSLVGLMRVIHDDLDQLYLKPGCYRMGIGTQLLQKAKEISPGRLRLYTFQVNDRARAFYEHHGFRAVDYSDGSRNEEKEADMLYQWQG